MILGIFDFATDVIGVDPGSETLRVIKNDVLIFNEKSRISYDREKNVVSGLGNSIRTTPSDVVIVPVNYVLEDFHAFEMMLRGAIKGIAKLNAFYSRQSRIHFCIPTNTSEVEKRAYRDSGEHAGAREVYMVHQSCCSAVGLNILFEKRNFILIDFGSSKVETTVFADAFPVAMGVIKFGTWKIYRLVKNHLRRAHKIDPSDQEIENVFSSLHSDPTRQEIIIQHRTVQTKEIQALLDNLFSLINDEILDTIEQVSNHPGIEKVIANGVFFTGGGSAMDYLRNQIKFDSRIRCTVSPTPFLDNINGLKMIMADKARFKDYVMV